MSRTPSEHYRQGPYLMEYVVIVINAVMGCVVIALLDDF